MNVINLLGFETTIGKQRLKLRRRIRMYIWKQEKKPGSKVANLRKLGNPADKGYQWGNSRLSYWRISLY